MHRKLVWPFSLLLAFICGCATTPAKMVKNLKCRDDIHQLQARENANLKAPSEDGLRADEVRTAINGHMPSVQDCYEHSMLAKTSDEKREIRFGFLIRRDGSVGKTCIEETQIDEVELQACLSQVLRGIHFPLPLGGRAVSVDFPFTFETHSH
jgi:hypothetical protein